VSEPRRTALVTGAGRGIGAAIARRLANDGLAVAVHHSASATAAQDVAESIERDGGTAFTVGGDLTDLDEVAAVFEQLRQHVDGLDVLVNNAGCGSGGMPTIESATPDDFDAVFGLNTRGLFFTTQGAVGMMRDGGRIVNLSSMVTFARQAGLSVYAGSKAAVDAFTRIWAAELAPRRITVNSVLPGIVDTDLIRNNMPEGTLERIGATVPLGRAGQPTDIADVVAFLCSDDARWITGQEIKVNGGAG
jgi:3-oxoacyl-[acyl-carrier protein] reductase